MKAKVEVNFLDNASRTSMYSYKSEIEFSTEYEECNLCNIVIEKAKKDFRNKYVIPNFCEKYNLTENQFAQMYKDNVVNICEDYIVTFSYIIVHGDFINKVLNKLNK